MLDATVFTEELFSELRELVKSRVDERRYAHILSVEKKACELADLLLPEKKNKARAAAILHDLTKCLSVNENLTICQQFGYPIDDSTPPQVLHAITAALLIAGELALTYPVLSDPEIFTAVRWHATGHDGMTTLEAIIYLADYIEDSRTYDDCVAVRNYFESGLGSDFHDNCFHFYKTIVTCFGYTIRQLVDENSVIDPNTVDSRNYYLNLIRSSRKGSNENDF